MIRRETFSIWPLAGAFAAAVIAAVVFVATHTTCGGPSKARSAETVIDEAVHLRFPAWRVTHAGCPRFAGELLDEPVDPWGRPYRVICVATLPRVVVTSAGEDGRFGTPDDISAGTAVVP